MPMTCAFQRTGGPVLEAPECGFVTPTERLADFGQVPLGIPQASHSHSADDEPVSSPASLWNKNKGENRGAAEGGDKFDCT